MERLETTGQGPRGENRQLTDSREQFAKFLFVRRISPDVGLHVLYSTQSDNCFLLNRTLGTGASVPFHWVTTQARPDRRRTLLQVLWPASEVKTDRSA